jgi:phosphatidylethanolamine/phosphatidyl-N-methylethanolamine N-methyltransferase
MKKLSLDYGSQEVFYRDYYQESRGALSKGMFSILWKYPHKVIERNYISNENKVIVELGVGFGEHVDFVQRPWNDYVAVDLNLREPLLKRFQTDSTVKLIQADAQKTDLPDNFADRLIATCLITHLENPEQALCEWNRLCKDRGKISIYMPCEGGILLKIFRKLVSSQKAKKQGFQGYSLFILREHINSYYRIDGLVKELFHSHQITVRRRPFPFLSWNLNLFSIYEIDVEK